MAREDRSTRDILIDALRLVTGVSGKLSLIIESGRGLRRSELLEMQLRLSCAVEELREVAGE